MPGKPKEEFPGPAGDEEGTPGPRGASISSPQVLLPSLRPPLYFVKQF